MVWGQTHASWVKVLERTTGLSIHAVYWFAGGLSSKSLATQVVPSGETEKSWLACGQGTYHAVVQHGASMSARALCRHSMPRSKQAGHQASRRMGEKAGSTQLTRVKSRQRDNTPRARNRFARVRIAGCSDCLQAREGRWATEGPIKHPGKTPSSKQQR